MPVFLLFIALLAGAVRAGADTGEPEPFTLSDAQAETLGHWEGDLLYLDYQSSEWFGLPMAVTVSRAPDGHAYITTAQYDDGPAVGDVYIVSISALSGEVGSMSESTAIFRKGRPMETRDAHIALEGSAGPANWTVVLSYLGRDGDRPARIRETRRRDGERLETLKEVDFADDEQAEWLTRNRSVLYRSQPAGDSATP